MKTLTIKDLSITEQLDSRAMSAVRGGTSFVYAPSSFTNISPITTIDASKKAFGMQSNSSTVMVSNATGNDVAFAAGLGTTILPVVNSSNNLGVH